MSSAIERLRAFARAAVAPLTPIDRRIVAETGLPVVYEAAIDPIQAAVQADLRPLLAAGNFPCAARAFDRLFAEKAFTGTGYRTYRVAYDLLLAPLDLGALESLPAYADWWLSDRSNPAAAACHARALLAVGHDALDVAGDDIGLAGSWRTVREHCGLARRVLAHAGPQGRRHWMWRQADLAVTFSAWAAEAEDEAMLLPAFAALQTLDPHEFGIYDDRAMQLLPCWTGTIDAMDRFARASADRTAAQFGDLLYARIYDRVFSEFDPEQTNVDPGRFLAALGDWYQRFPSQPLANRYASHAHAFGDVALVEHLFRGPLREIYPAHWLDRDQPLEAWYQISGRRRAGRWA